jgi:beta-glucanase (GH16 family)
MRLYRLKQLIALSGSVFVLSATSSTAIATTSPAQLAVPAGYQLVWGDEFDKDGLPDPAKWAYDTGLNKQGWHNNELQYYSGPRARNAKVQRGRLIITARREALRQQPDWGGQKYSSTRLITKDKQDWTYGFFEVRAKLPCGKGTWPAIWMLNTPVDWPAGGELDIVEHVGREPGRVFSTVHTAAGHAGNGSGGSVQISDACSAFHNYQMHWTGDNVRFGVNGIVHFEYKKPGADRTRWPFDAPQFLILNIAVGGDLGGAVDDRVFPVTMEIEHVRVYQAKK